MFQRFNPKAWILDGRMLYVDQWDSLALGSRDREGRFFYQKQDCNVMDGKVAERLETMKMDLY